MKKSKKQEILSRILVSSSVLVLGSPIITQAAVSIPAAAETVSSSVADEATLATSEALPEQQEVIEEEHIDTEETTASETEVAESTGNAEEQEDTVKTSTTEAEESTKATVTTTDETTESMVDFSEEKESKATKATTESPIYAVSADVSLLRGNSTEVQPTSQTLVGNNYAFLGVKGTFTVETNDLVAGNSIIIAEVTQSTTDLSGVKVNFDSQGLGITLLDNKGNTVGKIQYDNSLKAITLKVTSTVTAEGDIQSYSFMGPYMMGINVHSPSDVIAKMPFSNTISVSGKNYRFDFEKIDSDAATAINPDGLGFDNTPTDLSFNNFLYHQDIADNSVLSELQNSEGIAGAVLGNIGIKHSFKISTESDFLFTGAHLVLGNYYVSAESNKIQALEGDTKAKANWNKVSKKIPLVNIGNNLSLDELYDSANSTGIYYSFQNDGSYLVVEYISPEDTILTDEEIIANTRANPLAAASSDIEADIQATLDYYHGVLGNRASTVIPALRLKWADEYSSNTLTASKINKNGEVIRTVSATSSPNTIASGNTPVKVHFVDLNGQSLDSTVTKFGAPTDKANDLGDFSYTKATVEPKDIPGYSVVTDVSKLTTAQRAQLEWTNSTLGNYASTENAWEDKVIFATESGNVPYPGFADKSYDASGNIVPDGSGVTKGYGQTDVYYFYVGDPQKVVYNVIDDTEEKNLESNVDFDNGTTNANLTKKQTDLQAIADGYVSKGYEIVSVDPVPGVFDADEAKDQVVNIHLKHATQSEEETKSVERTIHYVYEDGKEAAPDQVDTVTYTRTITEDLVTGMKTEGDWKAKDDDTTFDAVTSPTINNYTPDKETVDEVTGVKMDDSDSEVTVSYTANTGTRTETKEVTQTIHYVYEDDSEAAPDKVDTVTFTRTVTINEATGAETVGEWEAKDDDTTFDAVVSPEIEHYTPDKQGVPEMTGLTADSKDSEVTVIYKANMLESTETKEVKQTIHYVYENGKEAAPGKVDTVTFTRTVTTNEATNEKTYGEWEANDKDTTFDAVASPAIKNYTADKETVEEVTGLTEDSKDSEVTVTYKPKMETTTETKEVNLTVHYVFSDGSKAADDYVDTVTFTRNATKNLATNEIAYGEWAATGNDTTFDEVNSPAIAMYTPDKTSVEEVTSITANSNNIEVTVTYKQNPLASEETKEVKRVIHYVYEDGKEAAPDKVDTVTFTRTVVQDFENDKVTYGEWVPKDNDKTFDEVASPEIEHYTADKATVEEVTGLTEESKDSEVTVTYKPNMVESTETKEVKQTIHYVYEDGKEAAADKVDTVTFTRTVTTNEATGEKTYGEWEAKDGDTTFDAVESAEIEGYTADLETVKERTGLTATDKDSEVTVTYTKKAAEPSTEPSTEPSEIPEESEKPAAKTTKTTNEKKLPQTGEETSSSAIYGGVGLIAAALLGVFFNRSRRNAKK
ncbi:LPXTG-domain-containing protein cell wall anchor domain protein [Enterococcus casseliflavus EC20]|uniref:LPXTG-domain-containing protein cell wall anchor domain protein n=1 Tax=Enterococcus casseliflavus EC20 TaxID=565655 RepID=C9AD29_ENTCA|nr:LPXTG cell wall anchor domain-containing protein [Enterococcus casseliflavus]EEV40788.1 LPXTG-domain-containing protein cell wall anchor domain protein [Enterococcus casseliflavus EC20]